MAMHVVLGEGEMTRKELTETLKDLWDRAAEEPFWFLLLGKSEPTATDQTLVTWLHKNEIYYEVVTDDADAMADIYSGSQNTHVAKRLSQKIVNLLGTASEEDETADVLALFTSDEPDAEGDRWLITALQATMAAGYPALGLNDGLVPIDMTGGEAEPEQEEEAVAPTKKTASKKPTKKAAAASPDEEVEQPTLFDSYTREDLEEMELPQLKEIAAAKGIELPLRTRMATYISHILGEAEEGVAVEVTEPPVTITTDSGTRTSNAAWNGNVDIEVVADKVFALVIEKLVDALKS